MDLFQDEDHYEVAAMYSHSKRSKVEDEKESPFPLVNYLGLPSFRPWSPSKAGYQPFPFPIHPQAYPRHPPKEKEVRKVEVYPAPPTLKERTKEASPPTLHPKKKYLEKGKYQITFYSADIY